MKNLKKKRNEANVSPVSILFVCTLVSITGFIGGEKMIRVDPERLLSQLDELAEFGRRGEGVNRVAFSTEDIQAREYLRAKMADMGLEVRVDAAGNLFGRRPGCESGLPVILFGSHSDTVPEGGKYDGALGVAAAIECMQVLEEKKITTRHPLEVVVFVDEEGGMIGSRALTGDLNEATLHMATHSGKTVAEGIRDLGGRPEAVDTAELNPEEVAAYVELHIEQGAALESSRIDIGAVEGIVGIKWWDVVVKGAANHAGTTPMDMRRDALLSAARMVLAVNEVVTSRDGTQVGTVGRIQAEPGAPNVIPGEVGMSLELRDMSADKIESLYAEIQKRFEDIAAASGTSVSLTPVDATAEPAPTDQRIQNFIAVSAEELGLSCVKMPSGAGHDAQEMAKITPAGLIFVPSVHGISHSPKEFTRDQDVVNGADVVLNTLLKIDRMFHAKNEEPK
jgi:beta-ureidopropionase / N-carbamoyl-L-amino-acid hydrolase